MPTHIHAGVSFPGRQAVSTIMAELERQKKERKDFLINSKNLEFKIIDRQILLKIDPGKGDNMLVPMGRRGWTQLAQWMGLRQSDRFYRWLAFGHQNPSGLKAHQKVDPDRNWGTWVDLINDYMHTEKEQRLVRCLADTDKQVYCRAMLSDKYNIISNADFFFCIVEALDSVGAETWHARLSEDKFYLYAVAPGITGQISTDRDFDPGDGWKSRWYGKEGDVMNAAVCAGNSETGEGGCFLSSAVLRRVCVNYCVYHDLVSMTHVGKRYDPTDVLLSDETIRKRNDFFFSKVTDLTRNSFDPDRFQQMLDNMNKATKDVVDDPERAADVLQYCFDISEDRKARIRDMFVKEQDGSRYGLANAVTAFAHDDKLDADVGYDLEKAATELFKGNMSAFYEKAEKVKKEREKKKGKVAEEAEALATAAEFEV
jgi:hypothetical protein